MFYVINVIAFQVASWLGVLQPPPFVVAGGRSQVGRHRGSGRGGTVALVTVRGGLSRVRRIQIESP